MGVPIITSRDSIFLMRRMSGGQVLVPYNETQYFKSFEVNGIPSQSFVFCRQKASAIKSTSTADAPSLTLSKSRGRDKTLKKRFSTDETHGVVLTSKGGTKAYVPVPHNELWETAGVPVHISLFSI